MISQLIRLVLEIMHLRVALSAVELPLALMRMMIPSQMHMNSRKLWIVDNA